FASFISRLYGMGCCRGRLGIRLLRKALQPVADQRALLKRKAREFKPAAKRGLMAQPSLPAHGNPYVGQSEFQSYQFQGTKFSGNDRAHASLADIEGTGGNGFRRSAARNDDTNRNGQRHARVVARGGELKFCSCGRCAHDGSPVPTDGDKSQGQSKLSREYITDFRQESAQKSQARSLGPIIYAQ